MIQTEIINERIHHWSDAGMKIRQIETGVVYDDAIDITPCPYTYEETDIPISDSPLEAREALDILMGGDGSADDTDDGPSVS